jgi:HSP20 family molecular chaperone IbpA
MTELIEWIGTTSRRDEEEDEEDHKMYIPSRYERRPYHRRTTYPSPPTPDSAMAEKVW